MKLSIVDLGQVPPGGSARDALGNSIALAQAAERAGYHRFWVAEHHGISASIANSCPAVVIGRIAAETASIRVGSGAVLLDYTPALAVAEQFRTLHAYFPDRIDLGIGRAASNSVAIDHALRPAQPWAVEPFAAHVDPLAALSAMIEHEERVTQLLRWLGGCPPADHPQAAIQILPGVSGGPALWLLGASIASAALAGRLGLAYCYAAFINPADACAAIAVYRGAFRPRPGADGISAPYAMLGVSLCCAETDSEADRLRASAELFHDHLARRAGGPGAGVPEPLLDPDSAIDLLGSVPAPSPAELATPWPLFLSAGPHRARSILEGIVAATGVDEIVIHDFIADHDSRLRSYELIAAACPNLM